MRILFLDIDGVLNTRESAALPRVHVPGLRGLFGNGHGYPALDPKTIAPLNLITDTIDANIVVSSTWRMGTEIDFQDLKLYLQFNGVKATVLGRTSTRGTVRLKRKCAECWTIGFAHKMSCRRSGYRGYEIEEWVVDNGRTSNDIVIVDDDSDMEPYMHRFVKTKFEDGLTFEKAKEAIEKFNP